MSDLYARYKRLIPRTTDLGLLILKGHLMIEEQLDAFVAANCERPNDLKDARLTFYQKMCLCQAMGGWPKDDPLWKFVGRMNSVRNKLAHTLEFTSLAAEVDRLLFIYHQEEVPSPITERRRASILRQTIGIACAYMKGFAEGRKETKE
jgi:hypothetical protein